LGLWDDFLLLREVENQIVVKLKNKEVTILAMENDKKAFENNLKSQ
jgi:hypothetical protein